MRSSGSTYTEDFATLDEVLAFVEAYASAPVMTDMHANGHYETMVTTNIEIEGRCRISRTSGDGIEPYFRCTVQNTKTTARTL